MRFPELVLVALLLIHRSTHLRFYCFISCLAAHLLSDASPCLPSPPQARARGHNPILPEYGQSINTKSQKIHPHNPRPHQD